MRKGCTEDRILHADVPVGEMLAEKLAAGPAQAVGVQDEHVATQNSLNWLGMMEQVEASLLEVGVVQLCCVGSNLPFEVGEASRPRLN